MRGPLFFLALTGALAAGQTQPPVTTVYISEAMSSNKDFYVDSDTPGALFLTRPPLAHVLAHILAHGLAHALAHILAHVLAHVLARSPDYIEVHNYGPLWVNLAGFRISDKCDFEGAYVFPGGVNIGPDERKVLLADGSGRQSQGVAYLDFRLSSSGETVCLFAPDGTLLSRVDIPPLGPNQAYGLVAGAELSSEDYQSMERPTPGEPNSGAAAPKPFDVEVVHPGAVPAGQSFRYVFSDCIRRSSRYLCDIAYELPCCCSNFVRSPLDRVVWT